MKIKQNPIKMTFIKKYGYRTYREIYFLCKFFDIEVTEALNKAAEDLNKLVNKKTR
ncbi:hypothetical protein AMYT_a0068 (plasmid) [Malaciobacter mytili LMG 24559]|uniref:hypothetical protein n=1 Tax=Malaciobacter mytili TaxID=603050 RepID=UPI000E102662|nr:hypothetical protein [Malaciobacter mytili]AXH16368.1 hypothetical protein AMYT_a0068 [Malaciobacter mytili LMG 24559]